MRQKLEVRRPPISWLHEILICKPETGELIWRERPRSHFVAEWIWRRWNRKYAGNRAGWLVNGYRVLDLGMFEGKRLTSMRAGRIVWAMTKGEWPTLTIDHINRVRDDDRIDNLRDATRSEQSHNRDNKDKVWATRRYSIIPRKEPP